MLGTAVGADTIVSLALVLATILLVAATFFSAWVTQKENNKHSESIHTDDVAVEKALIHFAHELVDSEQQEENKHDARK